MKTIRVFLACFAFFAISQAIAGAQAPSLAVLDLSLKDVSVEEMRGFVDKLSSSLFKTGRFTLIDREARDRALSEIEFSVSAAADEKTQIAIGRQLAADLIVTGSLGRYDEKIVYTLKTIETESSKVASVADDIVKGMERLLDDTDEIAETLADIPRLRSIGSGKVDKESLPEKGDGGKPAAQMSDEEFFAVKPKASFPFQFAIFSPVQLMPPSTAITLLRINLGYGENAAVSFIDVGFVNIVTGEMCGLQGGLFSYSGSTRGIQTGLVGVSGKADFAQANMLFNGTGTLSGFQLGLVNKTERTIGAQFGIVNVADKTAGIQVGVVNITGLLRGIQLGLVNVAAYGPGSKFMPFLNISL
jgi:hypothetical protein